MVGAVSSARIRRPGRDAGVPVRSPRRTSAPRAKLPLSIHVRSGPFSSCCAALLAVAPLVMGSGRLPLGQGLDFLFPPSLLLLLGRLSARPPLFSLPDAPFSCPQLDAFSISLNVPSPVVRRTRPPTWLALGLDQGPSSLLPRGTSFGRSVQPRPPFFRRGRSDLSARGRVPPIPEVPERVLAPNSFKRLHIHAVPSSSMPARPSLDTSPDDPHALLRAACPVSGARQLVLYPTPW